MQFNRRKALTLALGTGLNLACAVPLQAQPNYPQKPITIVVAYPAGGDTDALARLYADKLQTRLGQPVIVDNRPGASGIIGSSFVSKAPADGYTLLLAPSTFSIAQLVLKTSPGTGYDPVVSFTPIIQTGSMPLFVAASGATGVKDLNELLALARAKPLTYASPGSGSPMHILGELFNKATGANLSHVPYRGVAPAVNDLLGGHVPVTFMTYGPLAPHLSTGKAALLAVADHQRSPLAPQVPTLAELGYKDVEVVAWQGLFGPRGLPAEVVKTLNTQLNDIIKLPDVAAKMATFGALPLGGDPARLEKANANDLSRFSKLIKDFGIQAD
jgi:tripartite-type tricarboxylate transporter receptor subunit TctC